MARDKYEYKSGFLLQGMIFGWIVCLGFIAGGIYMTVNHKFIQGYGHPGRAGTSLPPNPSGDGTYLNTIPGPGLIFFGILGLILLFSFRKDVKGR